jgi:tRNA (guanine-N7-)-methyltransferase
MQLTVEASVLDIHREEELPLPELAIKTYYEDLHIAAGDQICYLRMLLDQEGSPTK